MYNIHTILIYFSKMSEKWVLKKVTRQTHKPCDISGSKI